MRSLLWILFIGLMQADANPLLLNQLAEGKLPANLKVIKVGPGALGKVRVTTENVPHPTTGVTEKQRVLEITGGDAAAGHYTLVILDQPAYSSLSIATRFRIVGGEGVRAAGVIFRMQPNQKDYYLLAVKPETKEAFWTVFQDGIPVKGFKYDEDQFVSPEDGWQSIKLQAEENTSRWTLNHRRDFITYNPETTPDYRRGMVGFWVRSDSCVQFAAPVIRTLKEERRHQLVALLKQIARENNRVLSLKLSARPAAQKPPVVIASLEPKDIGQPAHEVVTKVLETEENFHGQKDGISTVTVPVKDRNNNIIGAARMRLSSRVKSTQRKDLAYGNSIAKQILAAAPEGALFDKGREKKSP